MSRAAPLGVKKNLRQRLAAEHQTLGKKLAVTRALLGEGFSWDAARVTLAELRETLEAHFAMEEAGGYLAEVLAEAPEHGPAVEKLERDHARMRGTLATLLGEALVARSREEFTKNLGAFLATLTDHERRENDLVHATFSVDVAAGD